MALVVLSLAVSRQIQEETGSTGRKISTREA